MWCVVHGITIPVWVGDVDGLIGTGIVGEGQGWGINGSDWVDVLDGVSQVGYSEVFGLVVVVGLEFVVGQWQLGVLLSWTRLCSKEKYHFHEISK